MFLVFLLVSYFLQKGRTASVSDQTASVGLNFIEGVVAAYGDFNSDQATDVFVIADDWKSIYVYVWNVREQTFSKSDAVVKTSQSIVGIAPADFNGDGNMDLLVSMAASNGITAQVFFGERNSFKKSSNLKEEMVDQPTILDVNGDYYPDLFGTEINSNRTFWIYVPGSNNENGRFTKLPQEADTVIFKPNSNGFVDVTGDMHPDLVVKSVAPADKRVVYELWTKTKKNMVLSETLLFFDPSIELVGQSSYVDIDNDGIIDLIVPVCVDKDCEQSRIYCYSLSTKDNNSLNLYKWQLLLTNENTEWKFDPQTFISGNTPMNLNFGDYTMDGLVDAVAIFLRKENNKPMASQLINERCNNAKKCNGSRTFEVRELPTTGTPISISLMDVYENGFLDFILTYELQTKSKTLNGIQVLRNDNNVDAAFLKVAVLSGDKKAAKYGSNLPGSIVLLQTTNTDGDFLMRKGTQLSRSSYFALQLPYIVFGLGRSPNFVEKITVGVCKGDSSEVDRVKSWTAIIPNAQVIVIPTPKDNPSDWVTRLLVTPSKLLLQTGGVLIGTCLLIAGIILILHIKEKKEDEHEKRKEAHKFHFDAL